MGPVVIGLLVGLPVALLVARSAERMLFGLSAYDVSIYGVAAAALVGVAVGASIGPARRAATIDPIEAIRVS
jgi:ABC-type antimicrobial peptide transport system permease subunit